jgi:glycosyltransferase involved in cell wall biosynthesis
MRFLIDALGASAGGGLTYVRNALPYLAAHSGVEMSLLAGEAAGAELPTAKNLQILTGAKEGSAFSRFLWEQVEIPKLVRKLGAEVLLCAGNFAIWRSPVPQIVLSRNSLYTSADFARDLRRRGAYGMLAETWAKGFLARKSIRRAELTVAPSRAFAQELTAWSGREVVALHHGFDREYFFRDQTPLPAPILAKLKESEGGTRLLFVSHYNYYRNFETLLGGLALLKHRQPKRKIRLLLTCELSPGKNPGRYQTGEASRLLRELKIGDDVIQLGAIPYQQVHQLYRSCDLYVTPAYAESFAHPLVEAMACGLPIVASDLAVHREITNGAAVFFERFSPAGLADKVTELMDSPGLQAELRERGLTQANHFSWEAHAGRLLELSQSLLRRSA